MSIVVLVALVTTVCQYITYTSISKPNVIILSISPPLSVYGSGFPSAPGSPSLCERVSCIDIEAKNFSSQSAAIFAPNTLVTDPYNIGYAN